MVHLIPEQRMDKTGKIVIRHVNPEKAGSKSASSLPAPAAPAQPLEAIVLPEDKPVPMTKKDFETLSEVLDMCESDSNHFAYVSAFIRDGDMNAIHVFHKFANEVGFSTVSDVLHNTYNHFKKRPPRDYMACMAGHMAVASSGEFDYFDIPDNSTNMELLDIIHENTEQADAIVEFFQDRGADDPDMLRDYLANEVPALREGTL